MAAHIISWCGSARPREKNASIPAAVSVFPDEILLFPERTYPKLIHCNKTSRAATSLPGNTANHFDKKFAQGSDHYASHGVEAVC